MGELVLKVRYTPHYPEIADNGILVAGEMIVGDYRDLPTLIWGHLDVYN